MSLLEIRAPTPEPETGRRKRRPLEQIVSFRRPEGTARGVHALRLSLIAAALFGVIGAATAIPAASNMSDQATESRDSLQQPWLDAAAAYRAAQETGDDEISLAAAEHLFFLTNARDSAIVFDNVALLLLVVLSALLIIIPIRYLLLLRAMPSGNPRLWWNLRGLAILQIVLEIVKVFVLVWATSGTVYVELNLAFAPILVIAPAILWLLGRKDVQAHFSHHGYEPEPAAALK